MKNQRRKNELPARIYVRMEKDTDGTYFPLVELNLVDHADAYGETKVGTYGLESVNHVKLKLEIIKPESEKV